MYSSFVSLGKFIPKYFIIFVTMVNGIDSLISLSDFSWLVYRNASDFYVLILYPATLLNSLIQFGSVAQSCLTLCEPMDCSTPGFPVHYQLQGLVHIHVNSAIKPSPVVPFSCCLKSFPASGSFPVSQLFVSGGQNIGASALVLPLNIQD